MGPPPPAGEEKIGNSEIFNIQKNYIIIHLKSIVILKAVGGEIGSASALAPKLGPLGLVNFSLNNLIRNNFITSLFSHLKKLVKISKKPLWNGKVSRLW
jgi:hypothetical protein